MSHLELIALVVREYDAAIRFFVDVLQFDLVEDSPSLTNDGRAKRWVVVRPSGGQTGILLARADGERQVNSVGQQFAGRVGGRVNTWWRRSEKPLAVLANRRNRCGIRLDCGRCVCPFDGVVGYRRFVAVAAE